MSKLRENLIKQMQLRGWTAYELEKKSGVPQPTIHRFIKGKHGEPRGETIRKLADGLGLSESQLRGLEIEKSITRTWSSEGHSKNKLVVDKQDQEDCFDAIPTPGIQRVDANEAGPQENNGEYKVTTKLNKLPLIQIPLVKWHEIGDIINPNHRRKEFRTMPIIEGTVRADAFAIEIEDNQYSPYLNDSEAVVIEPVEGDTRGKRVLVSLSGEFHIMEHTTLECEYFLHKKNKGRDVPITEGLNYKIIGVVSEIYSIRKG